MKNTKQSGFTIVEIILVVVVLLIIAFLGWWVFVGRKNDQNKNVVTGALVAEDRQKLEAERAESAPVEQGQPSTSGSNEGNPSNTGQSSGGQTQTQNNPPANAPATAPQNNSPVNTPQSPPSAPSAPSPAPGYSRPTAAFCQEKNGASFTNAWVTDNNTHTYQIWENGSWVNKTETGTAARNYDTMKVVGVIPYLSQAAWAICSDKAGYVSFYYQPSGSVYTYNWLVAFEHMTISQP